MSNTDWSQLKHASGTSEHVPAALHDLLSTDAEARRRAYWKLDNYVVLQGSLYEAAPYVVRAILDAWPAEDVLKDSMYDLLIELANGDAPEDMTIIFDGTPTSIKRATLSALINGLELFLRDLRSSVTSVRQQAAEVLLALSDHVTLDSAELTNLASAEPDIEVRRLLDELVTESTQRHTS